MTDEELARRIRYHTEKENNADAFEVVVDWYLAAMLDGHAKLFSEIVESNKVKEKGILE
jgi:hypothetical protein